MSDFNILDHLRQQGFGHGSGQKNPKADKTNEESPGDLASEAAAHQIAGLAEHFGIDLQELGSAGIQRAFGGDTEGVAGKMIMPSALPDSQGGFLAKIIHAIFIKNREITDHTQGVGGAEGISGAEGIGAFSGGEGFQQSDFSAIAGSSGNFPDYPMMDFGSGRFADLGDLPSPLPVNAPSMPISRGGAELA